MPAPTQIEDLRGRLHQYTLRESFGLEAATSDGMLWAVEDLQHVIQHSYGVTYRSRTSYHNLFAKCGFSFHHSVKAFMPGQEADSQCLGNRQKSVVFPSPGRTLESSQSQVRIDRS